MLVGPTSSRRPACPTRTMSIRLTRSPCIGVCRYDARNLCAGCGRTPEEITAWMHLAADARHTINMRLLATQGEQVRAKLLEDVPMPATDEDAHQGCGPIAEANTQRSP